MPPIPATPGTAVLRVSEFAPLSVGNGAGLIELNCADVLVDKNLSRWSASTISVLLMQTGWRLMTSQRITRHLFHG